MTAAAPGPVAAVAAAPAGAPPAARIGPNAIIQLRVALERRHGRGASRAVFRAAGLSHYLLAAPTRMVDEREVITLHAALLARFDPEQCAALAREAGRLTADYVREHRIPAPARALLRLLPARLATRLLLGAIARNAWTFVGSGEFAVVPGLPTCIEIRDCPLCRHRRAEVAVCDYYAATFERLLRSLAAPRVRVVETACRARGDALCRFELRARNS